MQTGEVLRREVFNLLDAAKGGRLKKLKEVNKHEIVEGVTEDYMERRVQTLLSYVKQHSPYYKEHPEWTKLEDFPVMTKGDFIEHYDEVLVEPDVLLPENEACMRLPGIDGKQKMSKSLGNCIYLSDTESDVKKKIMSMYTDPTHIQISDPGHLEGNCVFTYLDAFSKPEHFEEYLPEYHNLDELRNTIPERSLGDVKIKKFLNNVIQEELAPIRARRAEFEKDIPAVYEILKKGSDAAREVAAQTLSEVKQAMKINYFDDEELIRVQSEKYQGV